METSPCSAPLQPTAPYAAKAVRTSPPMLDSSQLLQGQSTLLIQHNGEVYRLQSTRQGKLILTK